MSGDLSRQSHPDLRDVASSVRILGLETDQRPDDLAERVTRLENALVGIVVELEEKGVLEPPAESSDG